jgi:hypothetical protein
LFELKFPKSQGHLLTLLELTVPNGSKILAQLLNTEHNTTLVPPPLKYLQIIEAEDIRLKSYNDFTLISQADLH